MSQREMDPGEGAALAPEVLAAICEGQPAFVGVAGLDGRLRYLNPAGAAMVGLDAPAAAIGLPLDGLVPADERDRLNEALAQARSGRRWTAEGHLLDRATGAALAVEVHAFPILGDGGEPQAVAVVQRDITGRRRAEERLEDVEARLRLVLDQVPAFLWTTDRDLRVIELLGQATRASELTGVGQTLRERWGDDDPAGAVAAHERALAGQSVRDESTHGHRVLRSQLEPLRDRSGAIIGVVGAAFDVSEERALEAQLRHSQKMEAVGQLAGGIAHDYNNMLLGIMGNLDLALRKLDPAADDIRRSLQNARQAAERSAELTRRLLTFARKDVQRPAAVDPRAVIRRAAELLGRTLGASVAIDLRLEEVAPVWIDPIRLEQVVMNLAINARDAMPDGGTLTVSTTMRGDRVEIVVSDDGVGIPPAAREHVFEPFFTTKPEGTGLGLSTVYAIVVESGGELELTSEEGRGTTISIRFAGITS